jgi:uncharacterized integral membrane protein
MACASCPAAALTSRSMRLSRCATPHTRAQPLLTPVPPRLARCRATASGDAEPKSAVFDGIYGRWSMEPADYAEVWGYRAALACASLCGAGAAAEMLLFSAAAASSSSSSPPPLPPVPLDALLAGGSVSLGAALVLIHVYVTPLKRFVQLLWLLGTAGALAIHFNSGLGGGGSGGGDISVLGHAAAHPAWDVLLLGPLAAAATGVAVKEGFCFRRPEAAALALSLPALCLTHLLSAAWPPAAAAVPPLGGVTALAAVALAAGKAVQDPKGDVGDKSVFEFRKLSNEERERVLARLRAADDAALRGEAAALARERAEARREEEEEMAGGGGGGGGSAR